MAAPKMNLVSHCHQFTHHQRAQEAQSSPIARHVSTEVAPLLPLQNLQRAAAAGRERGKRCGAGSVDIRGRGGSQVSRAGVYSGPVCASHTQAGPPTTSLLSQTGPRGAEPRRAAQVLPQTLYPDLCCDCGKPHQIRHGPPKLRPSRLRCGLKVPFLFLVPWRLWPSGRQMVHLISPVSAQQGQEGVLMP